MKKNEDMPVVIKLDRKKLKQSAKGRVKAEMVTQPCSQLKQQRQADWHFMQETRLIESEYSVNLPTRFYYRKRWNNGWINVVNPFRASIVLGTPGSGKSYAVVNSFIKQQIEKGFSMYVYDFKFSDLSTIAYSGSNPFVEIGNVEKRKEYWDEIYSMCSTS